MWFALLQFAVALGVEPEAEDLSRLPFLSYQPEPVYPSEALESGSEADVLLELAISDSGVVLAAVVLESGGPEFDKSALQAALSFRFEPGLDSIGGPTSARIRYRYLFQVAAVAALSLEGSVLDPATSLPIPEAVLRITFPSTGEEQIAISDEEGFFAFSGLTLGSWNLLADVKGRAPGEATFEVGEGTVTRVTIYPQLIQEKLIDGGMEIVVEARRTEVGITERVLTTEEIRYLPGTSGDVVRVVQNLPGVARAPLNIGQLIIRGVAPEDSAYFLDGGRIPLVFHFAGLTTIIPSDTISEVAFLPGSYSVRYGRTLGGLVDLRTSPEPPAKRRRTYSSVDVYQATIFSEWQAGENGSFSLSGRRSYADAILNPILNKMGGMVRAPRYYDAQVRGRARDAAGGDWDAFLVVSDDRFLVLGDEDDRDSVQIGYVTSFQKLRLQRIARWTNGWYNETILVGGPELRTFQFAGDGEAYEKPMMGGVRQEFRRGSEPGVIGWRIGTDTEFGLDRYLYDVPGFGEKEQGESWMFVPAFYLESTLPLGLVEAVLGIRADALFFEEGWVGPSLDPRLALRLNLTDTTMLKAGVGRHSQFPETRQLLSEGDGNPELTPEWALQSSMGVEQRIFGVLTGEITGFWNDLNDLVSGREDAFRFFTGPPDFGPFDTDGYANDGEGLVYGVEALLRLQSEKTVGLLAFTWSHSSRVDRPGAAEELFRYDQPFTLNALFSREINKDRRVGARIRSTSGFPYTPVANRVYELDSREFFPVFGERDSARLPPFFALDIRFDKSWTFKHWQLDGYLDLQNATNSVNPEVMSWTYDYGEEDPVPSNPLFPSFGLRAEW